MRPQFSRFLLAVLIALSSSLSAFAQTPQQRQQMLQRQREHYLQALYYQQLMAQQSLFPTPLSRYAMPLSYAQTVHHLALTRSRNSARVPPARLADIEATLQRVQAVQFSMYPMTLHPAVMPLNSLQVAAARSLGIDPPLLENRFPFANDDFLAALTLQQATVNHVEASALASSLIVQPQFGGPLRLLPTAMAHSIKRNGPAALKVNAAANLQLRRDRGNVFRAAPGERELELARLWSTVDAGKATTLYQKAISRAGENTWVAATARQELEVLSLR